MTVSYENSSENEIIIYLEEDELERNNRNTFIKLCKGSRLEVAKWLLEKKPDFVLSEYKDEVFCEAFVYACSNGHLEVAKWLFEQDIDESVILSSKEDAAFREACSNGHLEVAKWILKKKSEIYIYWDITEEEVEEAEEQKKWMCEFAFRKASANGHLKVAQWLHRSHDDERVFIDNKQAYEYIMNKNTKGLDTCKFHTRVLIERVKNKTDALAFLLDYVGHDPGANSGFFTNIIDNRTFDLYKEYDIDPVNLYKHDVTNEQWEYIYSIGYIDKETYEDALMDED